MYVDVYTVCVDLLKLKFAASSVCMCKSGGHQIFTSDIYKINRL
jgi:hypothetical protein